MSKFELSVSKDYVPGWGIVDAVRELFQNALDQQTTVSGNKMFFGYDPKESRLTIGNKKSVLTTSSLLLGSSTKRGDDDTIGQFGEGYKIATLILCREGKEVTFYNYGAKEVWKPRFVKSRRYKSEILTFFVDKKFMWTSVPDNDLSIVIDNITEEEYEEIVKSNLHLSGYGENFETENGSVLLDPSQKGNVYVNGLFICNHEPYHYGYNFKPQDIKLDRDRKLVSDFNLQWLASKIWASSGHNDEMVIIIAELAAKNAADVRFLTESVYGAQLKAVADTAYRLFVEEHGPNAYPVSNMHEMSGLSEHLKPVIVSESHLRLLKMSGMFREPVRVRPPSFKDKVTYWLDTWEKQIDVDAVDELKSIIEAELF